MNLPTMTATWLESRNDGMMDDPKHPMDHWRCTLSYKGRRMTVTFSMGAGHNGKEPEAKEVLESLFSDAVSGTASFADFCSDMGYDEDSRKAERAWKACQSINIRLRKLLAGDFDALQAQVINW